MNAARRIERLLFPSNVVAFGGTLLLAYLGWMVEDVLTFFPSLSAYAAAIFIFKGKIADENKLYATSTMIAFPVFVLCSLISQPVDRDNFRGLFLTFTSNHRLSRKIKVEN